MTSFLHMEGQEVEILSLGWRMAEGGPDSPGAWHPAQVPGTVAGALTDAGLFSPAGPSSLHDRHYCYHRIISGEGGYALAFDGLATFADVYLDSELILASTNMFHHHVVPVELHGKHELLIHFKPLTEAFAQTKPRARWRTQMIANAGARHVRTTLLGQMPGWCPNIEAVGPWRPITLKKRVATAPKNLKIAATLEGSNGVLRVSAEFNGTSSATLHCNGQSAHFAEGRATLVISAIKSWWPHTHGEPVLYPAHIEIDGEKVRLGQVGFHNITLDRGADDRDFKILVNGVPVFCRGAVWTNADILNLSGTRETYEPLLRRARDSGMNMLRMSGTGAYESRAFYDLCAELGIMIWQDFMFANFDYPTANPDFADSCIKEAEDFLNATMGSPSLAVLCGGSEMMQQAAMMGLPSAGWHHDLIFNILSETSAEFRPDLPYEVNSPSGGSLPFIVNEGVTHYYGVGAYKRPLEDARRANVRFATECLAFSQLPEGELDPASPDWKSTVPKDRGADWDFEDTRDHYLETLFHTNSAELRAQDPALWLRASRAVTGHVMEATFAEWRRLGSSCNGALVWTFQDLAPGLGWGIVEHTGKPKPALFALKRAFKPQAVLLTDEGCNGLAIHLINERPVSLAARLEFSCLQDNGLAIISESRELSLAPHSAQMLSSADLIDSFFDVTYAYRFGPQAHYGSVARLYDQATGDLLSEAFHFPAMRPLDQQKISFAARLETLGPSRILTLESEAFLHFVHIHTSGFELEDNWFHLAPGQPKKLLLKPVHGVDSKIEISALNTRHRVTL